MNVFRIAILTIFTAVGSMAVSQTDDHTQRAAEAQTSRMEQVLDLTPEQKEQVHALNVKVTQKIHAIRENTSLTDDKKNEFIAGNMTSKRRVLTTFLTPDQMEKYDAMMSRRRTIDRSASAEEPQERPQVDDQEQ